MAVELRSREAHLEGDKLEVVVERGEPLAAYGEWIGAAQILEFFSVHHFCVLPAQTKVSQECRAQFRGMDYMFSKI